MNPEQPADEELSFGEKLLGLQGFSATRAKRYREELDQLLVHRISKFERWGMAFYSVFVGAALIIGGVSIVFAKGNPLFAYAPFDQARVVFGATCALTGGLLGGWLLALPPKADTVAVWETGWASGSPWRCAAAGVSPSSTWPGQPTMPRSA